MMSNGTLNFTVYGDCDFIQSHLNIMKQSWQTNVSVMILVICATRLFIELLELFQNGLGYLTVDNIADVCLLCLYFSSWLVLIMNSNSSGAITLTATWLNLLSLIRKMPYFGIYVVMFIDVSYTFLKVSFVCLLFIIAFCLGFNVLLSNQPYFSSIIYAMIKTLIMTSGEMEYDNLFFDNQFNYEVKVVPYMDTTKALFVVFVLVMPIIIMNLLVGLAVDDIKTVQENAVLKRIAMQVELVLGVEKLLPDCLREKWVVKTETLYPNRTINCLQYVFRNQPSIDLITRMIISSNNNDVDNVKMKNNSLSDNISIKKLQKELETMKQMVIGLDKGNEDYLA